eukprot:GHUV01047430.1.p1 GENE.GHUV01047430.1~~GHUV01047430.1.p1  ORF type:complete len:176 (+),score=54.05 GHUV01047430.1:683-1210(+)
MQIRVFGVQRTTDGFDARKYCDKRKYEYILPAWVFDPQACSTARTLPDRGALQAVAAAVLVGRSSSNGPASNGVAAAAAADASSADASGSESAGGGVLDGAAKSGGETTDETAASSRLGDEKLKRLRWGLMCVLCVVSGWKGGRNETAYLTASEACPVDLMRAHRAPVEARSSIY